jgi:hypothetical protein
MYPPVCLVLSTSEKIIVLTINVLSGSFVVDRSHKSDEKAFRTDTPKSTNQNVEVVGYDVLIGYFSSIIIMSVNLVLKYLMYPPVCLVLSTSEKIIVLTINVLSGSFVVDIVFPSRML